MNQQAISHFVQALPTMGLVRAKYLPRHGRETRLTAATATVGESTVEISGADGRIAVNLSEIEQILFAPEDRKFFVHLTDGLLELRPDTD